MNYTWIDDLASQDEQFEWLEKVRELDRETHPRPPESAGPYPISFFRQALIEEMAKTIIAYDNEKLVGHGILNGTVKPDVLVLARVYVRSGYRQQGIGRKLLQKRVGVAAQQSCFLRATTGLTNHGSLKNMFNYNDFIGFQTVANMYRMNVPVLLLGRPPSGFRDCPTITLSEPGSLKKALKEKRVLRAVDTRDGNLVYNVTKDTFNLALL